MGYKLDFEIRCLRTECTWKIVETQTNKIIFNAVIRQTYRNVIVTPADTVTTKLEFSSIADTAMRLAAFNVAMLPHCGSEFFIIGRRVPTYTEISFHHLSMCYQPRRTWQMSLS